MEKERGGRARSFWWHAVLLSMVSAGAGCRSAEDREAARGEGAVRGPVSGSQALDEERTGAVSDSAGTEGEPKGEGEWPEVRTSFLAISLEEAVRSGTPVRIIARHSEQCLDVAGGSADAFAKLVQWPCYDRVMNQRFCIQRHGSGYHVLVAQHSGKCLDLGFNSPDLGAGIIQYACHGNESNLFSIEPVEGAHGYYAIRPKRTGMCLDVWGNLPRSGASVRQGPCHSDWNQQFRFERDLEWQ